MPDTGNELTNAEHAVITRYRLADDGFGEQDQRSTIRQAQEHLAEAIDQADAGEFDGNEFGAGQVTLYAYGPDADALYTAMAPVLRGLPFRPAHVILRYGSAFDPSAAEHRVDL